MNSGKACSSASFQGLSYSSVTTLEFIVAHIIVGVAVCGGWLKNASVIGSPPGYILEVSYTFFVGLCCHVCGDDGQSSQLNQTTLSTG